MPALIIYLIKANIALTLFYFAYRFGLRRLTFYMLNRFFLLFGIAFSALFPLLNLNAFFQHHQQLAGSVAYYAPDWNTLQQYVQPQNQFTVWTLIAYVFWAGVIVMFIRFCMQMLSLFRIHLRTEAGFLQEEKIRFMHDRINPFSFFKNIYINPELHTENELEKILIHEKIHAKGWHTADVLAGEINNIFYWFNPGAWMMKTAIQENLEFITDRKILSSGMDAKSYQYSLIKVSSIPFANPLINHFNFSHLKTRIKMMNRKKSPGFHLLRYLLILPVLTIVVLVMTSSQRQSISLKTVVNITKGAKMNFQSRVSIPLPYAADALPAEYINFLRRNPSVKTLEWFIVQDEGPTLIHISLKNGTIESYHANNPEEMKKAQAKYGKFPAPPPPPPPVPAKTGTTSFGNIIDTTIGNDRYYAQLSYQKAREKDYGEAESYANKALKLNPDNAKATSVLRYVHQMKEYNEKMEAYRKEREKGLAPKATRDKEQAAYDAQLSYQLAKNKRYNDAMTVAQDAVKLNPDNAKAKQVLRYVTQMQEYQKKMEEYEKAHKDMDAAPAHAVNFNYPINNHGLLSGTSPAMLLPGQHYAWTIGPNNTLNKAITETRYERYNLKGNINGGKETSHGYTHTIQTGYAINDTGRLPQKNVLSKTSDDNKDFLPSNALYIVNDKKVNREYIQQLNPQNISSISVLKDNKAAILKYGPTAKEGVIKIYTKAYEAAHPSIYRKEMKNYERGLTSKDTSITLSANQVVLQDKENITMHSKPVYLTMADSNKPVILINGKVMNGKSALDKISPNEIDSVVVMKRDLPLLIKQYGAQAKNGIVKIYTKVE